MFGKSLVFTIMLLFLMGVEKVKPLKCFDCLFGKVDGKEKSNKECSELKPSNTDSKFLIKCPDNTKTCGYAKYTGKDKGKSYEVWSRYCSDEDRSDCRDINKDDISMDEVNGKMCNCKTDACNKAPGVTLSYTLMTLCLSWAVLRNINYLF